MVVLDTCILIYDSLSPEKLTNAAREALNQGEQERTLACADISLWELAMLMAKGRLDPGTSDKAFIQDVLAARSIEVLPITPAIASVSSRHPMFQHADPADRIIAATALCHKAPLITCDAQLVGLSGLATIW